MTLSVLVAGKLASTKLAGFTAAVAAAAAAWLGDARYALAAYAINEQAAKFQRSYESSGSSYFY
jgi:hypothetical protein